MSSWKFKIWANTRITIARELCCLKARGILIESKVPKMRLGFYVSCNRHRVYCINVYIYIIIIIDLKLQFYFIIRSLVTIHFFQRDVCVLVHCTHQHYYCMNPRLWITCYAVDKTKNSDVPYICYYTYKTKLLWNCSILTLFKVIFRQWIYNKMPCKISYTKSRMILLHWLCVQLGVGGVSTGVDQASSIKYGSSYGSQFIVASRKC